MVSNKALVNAFLICLIARYPPFLLGAESPSASACAIALVSCCEHVQRCIGLKRLRVIVCKGNKNKSYTPYLITIFFYFLPFSRGKTQKKTSGEPYLAPPISSLLKLFLETFVLQCGPQEHHVGIKLILIEHAAHLLNVLANGLVNQVTALKAS